MPSFEFVIGERERAGSRFISRVRDEIQKAVTTEKKSRKLTQQSIANRLDVNRSVVNRQIMGLENMTARSIGELFWAIGWEPYFEARKTPTGANDVITESPKIEDTSKRTGRIEAGRRDDSPRIQMAPS